MTKEDIEVLTAKVDTIPQAQENSPTIKESNNVPTGKDIAPQEQEHSQLAKEVDGKSVSNDITPEDREKLSSTEKADEITTAQVVPQEEQPKPFQVVLVDLKKAATKNEIHCVEKPLMGSHDLKYVAISYRWGELHETMVDTKLGYVANITSFDLNSFFVLCRAISRERDLKDLDYVWIDAICVDQINPVRRKATIYRMTDIYDRANYIVAVPDLHLQHLKDTNKKNALIIEDSLVHRQYLYHLINGDFDKLANCDKEFLDGHKVPDDSHLRHLLINFTEHFARGFTTCQHHDSHYDPKHALQHIFETNAASRTKNKHHHVSKACRKMLNRIGYDNKADPLTVGVAELHKCDNPDTCPLDLFYHHANDEDQCDNAPQDEHKAMDDTWKQRIPERGASIRQSMDFLADLVQDWSNRVWVISEYNIAKKKSNKLKYWFIQLTGQNFNMRVFPTDQCSFFELYFDGHADDASSDGGSTGVPGGSISDTGSSSSSLNSQTTCVSAISNKITHKSNAVYHTFHDTIQQQLNQQTFLEMILKSKASRNADRFHAILPSSEYKTKLSSKEKVDEWEIQTLGSVKLQLYQWTSMIHKLELLFLSCNAETASNRNTKQILPTFATSRIYWPPRCRYPTFHDDHYRCNFDLTSASTLELITLNSDEKTYKLKLMPKEYYTSQYYYEANKDYIEFNEAPLLRRLLKLHVPEKDTLDLVCIPNFGQAAIEAYRDNRDWEEHHIFLVGCFVKNKWILKQRPMYGSISSNTDEWKHHYINDHYSGFDIY